MRVFIFAILLLLHTTHAALALPKVFLDKARSENCGQLIEKNRAGDFSVEKQMLDKIDLASGPKALSQSLQSAHKLDTGDVYLLTFKDGNQFIYRRHIPDSTNSIPVETFNTKMIQGEKQVALASVRPLTKEETKTLQAAMEEIDPTHFGKDSFEKFRGMPKSQGSLAPVFHAKTGEDYIIDSFGYDMRHSLDMVVRTGGSQEFTSRLSKQWAKATPQAKQSFIKDLSAKIHGLETASDPLAIILKSTSKLTTSDTHELIDMIWMHLPQNARTELAKQWTMRSVLGSNDFQNLNWLAHETENGGVDIVGIDVALQTEEEFLASARKTGTVDGMFQHTMFPLTAEDLTPKELRMLMDALPKGFLNQLDSHWTDAMIRKTAKEAGMKINPGMVGEFRARLKALKDKFGS